MIYNLQEFDKLVDLGYLRRQETDKLVQYTYTEQTDHERFWNEYTRAARGIILEKATGKVIAKPFEKFFNLGAIEETYLVNLPKTSYKAYEKMDGSLGIIYYYNDQWNVATKGSFSSEQAIKAQEMLKKYNINILANDITLLVEIIYPENKIVVNYGDTEELVIIGGFNRDSGQELSPNDVHDLSGLLDMPLAGTFDYTIGQMIELQKTIPKDQEGFVVRFDNGFRVKIKGEEYLKIHKIISCLSPLSLWEVMNEEGKVDSKYIQQIPEEYQPEFEPLIETLETQYEIVSREILNEVLLVPGYSVTVSTPGLITESIDKKTIGMFVQGPNNGLKHPKAMFPYILNNTKALHKYILNQIRPTANTLREL